METLLTMNTLLELSFVELKQFMIFRYLFSKILSVAKLLSLDVLAFNYTDVMPTGPENHHSKIKIIE